MDNSPNMDDIDYDYPLDDLLKDVNEISKTRGTFTCLFRDKQGRLILPCYFELGDEKSKIRAIGIERYKSFDEILDLKFANFQSLIKHFCKNVPIHERDRVMKSFSLSVIEDMPIIIHVTNNEEVGFLHDCMISEEVKEYNLTKTLNLTLKGVQLKEIALDRLNTKLSLWEYMVNRFIPGYYK